MIRELEVADSAAAMMVTRHAIIQKQSPHYSTQVIDNLKEKFDEQYFIDAANKHTGFVFDAIGVLAVIVVHVEDRQIEALFVDPSYLRKGIGSQLLRHAEHYLRERSVDSVELLASKNSTEFYEKHGYEKKDVVNHQLYGQRTLLCKQL